MVLLPLSLLEELSSLPEHVASPSRALEHDLLGEYTGINLILESRLHHSIVQRKLTPRLEGITPYLEEELNSSFKDFFPACDDVNWCEFQPYQILGRISARLSARALVGRDLCRNPEWIDISFNYTENCEYMVPLRSSLLRLFYSSLLIHSSPKCSGLLWSYVSFPNGSGPSFAVFCLHTTMVVCIFAQQKPCSVPSSKASLPETMTVHGHQQAVQRNQMCLLGWPS